MLLSCWFIYIVYSLFVYSVMIVIFFFNDTATTEIYTLSLHDALPIWTWRRWSRAQGRRFSWRPLLVTRSEEHTSELRHMSISYAVFCLKKKKKLPRRIQPHQRPHLERPGSATIRS